MKIRINQDIVEFTPENPAEKTELEALWRAGGALDQDVQLYRQDEAS